MFALNAPMSELKSRLLLAAVTAAGTGAAVLEAALETALGCCAVAGLAELTELRELAEDEEAAGMAEPVTICSLKG